MQCKNLGASTQFVHGGDKLDAANRAVEPPSTTSHVECTEQERRAAGIPEGLVRYSVGIEDLPDLLDDMDQALSIL